VVETVSEAFHFLEQIFSLGSALIAVCFVVSAANASTTLAHAVDDLERVVAIAPITAVFFLIVFVVIRDVVVSLDDIL
jgi:Co/Zn/Cd efflux system component